MTAVYRLQSNPKRYYDFAFVNPEDEKLFLRFDGSAMAARWQRDGSAMAADWHTAPITVADEGTRDAELADHVLLGIVPVFSVTAVDALLDLLRPNGELLPLRYGQTEYMAYNVTRVADALDERQSALKRFVDGGGVMSIQRYAFRPDAVRDLTIFKIPQLRRAFVYVTDVFAERAKHARLTGFVFISSGETIEFSI